MISLEISQILLLIVVCAGAGFIQRVSGFGLGIFAMLFLPHFLPSNTAASAMICIISCGTSSYNAIKYRKQIPFRTILPLFGAAMVMIPIVVRFSAVVPEKLMKSLLGMILIVLSIYFLFFNSRIHIKATVKNGVIAGALSGILNGLFATGGPPAVLYLTHATANNLAYFAGIQFFFSLSNVYSTIFRAINGILTREIWICAGLGFLGAIAGDWVGRRIFDKLNAKMLKQIIYIGMIISGFFMIA